MKKKLFTKILCLLLGFAVIFGGIYAVMDYNYADSIIPLKRFYQQKENSIDVLGLGTSHIYEGLCPAVLYREYGIAAYDLCAPAQAVWSTYYYFVEALKTQRPKAVVFDTYMLNTNTDFDTTANAIKTTYGMRWSRNRLNALQAAFEAKDVVTALNPFNQIHSRYDDLSSADILPYAGNKAYYGKSFKGFATGDEITEITIPDVTQWTAERTFNEKHERYYRAIIELAVENKIPIYVIAVPYAIASDTQSIVNTARRIAAEYDSDLVRFIDFDALIDEMGVDTKTDFSNKQHLNYAGSRKFTSYFGKILKTELELPDRRTDAVYDSWAENADMFYRCYEDFLLKHTDSMETYLQKVQALDDGYTVILAENTGITTNAAADDALIKNGGQPERPAALSDVQYGDLLNARAQAQKAAFPDTFFSQRFGIARHSMQGGIWLRAAGNTAYTQLTAGAEKYTKYLKFKFTDSAYLTCTATATDDGKLYTNTIAFNGKKYSVGINEIGIFVYDNRAEQFVDFVTIAKNEKTVKR